MCMKYTTGVQMLHSNWTTLKWLKMCWQLTLLATLKTGMFGKSKNMVMSISLVFLEIIVHDISHFCDVVVLLS